jgi:hypothetical protein
MSKAFNLITKCLNEMSSGSYRVTYESLEVLLEHLEDKTDPSQDEIQIVEAIYEFIEKFKLLESSLKKHSVRSGELLGDKIQSLYNQNSRSILE